MVMDCFTVLSFVSLVVYKIMLNVNIKWSSGVLRASIGWVKTQQNR